jgi:cytochrome c oxidase assembly factor CtaG
LPVSHHATTGMSLGSAAIGITLIVATSIYARGWRRLHEAAPNAIPAWKAVSFVAGTFLLWGALASPLATYEHDLLTIHMLQHLLLMTVAPALILLGEPLLAFARGLPPAGQIALRRFRQSPLAQRVSSILSAPAVCWTLAAVTLVAWHVPALLTLALHSELWHSIEQASFLVAGFLFWYPVVQPWPRQSLGPQWSTLLYLFLATLPCDALSGFLLFSERVAYPAYFSMPRSFGLSVMDDQQLAAALMWTCVTLVYLVPAAILSTRLLSPRTV